MKHEKLLRLLLLAGVAAIHICIVLFLVINTKERQRQEQEEAERASVMRLIDLDLLPELSKALPIVEEIAEEMIETEEAPLQTVVAAGTLSNLTIEDAFDDYKRAHEVDVRPVFNEKEIYANIVFPPIAQRAGIEGNVFIELFIDRYGIVKQVLILKEDPPDRGFGEAAVNAFKGLKVTPALSNGVPVSCRFRYPLRFVVR